MNPIRSSRVCAFAFAVMAANAFGANGVIEINHAKILASGGYPYQIGSAGSYILTSNLAPPLNTNALTFASSAVTLDLNGFSIIGTGNPPCGAVPTAIAALGTVTNHLRIRNGYVFGFCIGISLGTTEDVTVENVHVTTIGNGGIYTGINAIIRGNHFNAPDSGINCPSIVVDTSFVGSLGNNGIPTATCAKANLIGNF